MTAMMAECVKCKVYDISSPMLAANWIAPAKDHPGRYERLYGRKCSREGCGYRVWDGRPGDLLSEGEQQRRGLSDWSAISSPSR